MYARGRTIPIAALLSVAFLNTNDSAKFAGRERDWRNGAVVNQVFVDRFAPSADLGADVLYLNPVFSAFTNHKYNSSDDGVVDPQYEIRFRDLLSDYSQYELSALITVEVPAHAERALSPLTAPKDGYSTYKRMPVRRAVSG